MNRSIFVLLITLSFSYTLIAQNVGIGTATPSENLHVIGAALFESPGASTGSVRVTSPGGHPGISLYSNGPSEYRADIQRVVNGISFRLHDNTTYPPARMTLHNNGRVGIGTATPAALLSVADGTQLGGTAASTTFRTNSGTLSTSFLEETALASFGIKSGGNNVSLGIRAIRSTAVNNWHGTALGLGFDVDNTKRAGGGIWITEGKVGINTLNMPGSYSLYVPNGILTERVKVAAAGSPQWADYVFDSAYDLKSLTEVEQFIEQNSHLPNIPSAKEIGEKGYEMTEMNVLFMEKIEELFLHTIQQQKEIDELKKMNEELLKRID